MLNRLRWRWRRRTASAWIFVQHQVDRAKNWIHPPPRTPSVAELAMIERDELMREARRRRYHWRRGPLDPQAMADPLRRL